MKSWCQFITLKQDRDPMCVSSYRPISLLSVETKILTKILSNSLRNHVTKLIHTDQTGFTPKWYIYFTLRRLFNLIYSPIRKSDDSVVIALNAQKAFDQIEWPYMFAVLSKFGFGDSFINWMRIYIYITYLSLFDYFVGHAKATLKSPFIFALGL